jgi:hypothetical protein
MLRRASCRGDGPASGAARSAADGSCGALPAPLCTGEPRLLEGQLLHLGQLPADDARTARLELLARLAGATLLQEPPAPGERCSGAPQAVLLMPAPEAKRRLLRALRQRWGECARLLVPEWLEDSVAAAQVLGSEGYAVRKRPKAEGSGGKGQG